MTYPRAHLVDAKHGGFYHCISRCVRRGWLCGRDSVSGRSFEHRRAWVEARLLELASVFAIDLYAYAVMSNHYHCVVQVRPGRVHDWSDDEVAHRWSRLCPGGTEQDTARNHSALLESPERLAEIRTRLGSLSWFMRFINEPIARRANREDGVTGRFWEGRFKSVALLDEASVVACMAYVDLNPVRAKMTRRAEDAEHTSIARRVQLPCERGEPLASLAALALTLTEYRALLEWTVGVHNGSCAVAPDGEAARALVRLQHRPDAWLGAVRAHRFKYRAYGALSLLRQYAKSLGQRYLCGARPGMAAPA